MEQSQTPEMDALVDSLLKGERVLLFAPGVFYFCAAGACTGFGIEFLTSVMVPALLGAKDVPTRALSQVGGVLLASAVACTAALFVVHGFAFGHKVWKRVAIGGLVLGGLMLALSWSTLDDFDRVASRIAFACFALATLLLRSTGFSLFVLFRRRLKVRREVILAQMRTTRG